MKNLCEKIFLDCLTLKMKALPSFETLVIFYHSTRRNIPEGKNLQDFSVAN